MRHPGGQGRMGTLDGPGQIMTVPTALRRNDDRLL
jgi:hypothetical protein